MSARSALHMVAMLATGACTPYDPQLPGTPFYCGSAEPKCPDGYTCMQMGSGSAVCASAPTGGGSCAMPFTGALATWDLSGEPGSQTSTPASTMAPGVTASAISRSSALMASPGTGSIAASNWPTSSQRDPSAYFTISLAPPAGCALALSSLAIDVKSSTTGPTQASLATSTDTFAHEVAVATTAATTANLSVTGATTMIEIRIYGFAATATSGTMRVQNQLVVSGALH